MPRILFLPDQQCVEVSDLETVLFASLRARIPHVNECRGNARCSTCRVLVLSWWRSNAEDLTRQCHQPLALALGSIENLWMRVEGAAKRSPASGRPDRALLLSITPEVFRAER